LTTKSDSLSDLSRENLAERTVDVLHRGGWGNPDVLLVRVDDREIVVKDYRPRSRWVRTTIGRLATSREIAVYRALRGSPAVPRLLGCIDELAFALEYRPGTPVSRRLASTVPRSFIDELTAVDELTAAVDGIHARGVVHLDLRHRSNVLFGADGHPVLIDFATALRFRRRSLGRWTLFPVLRWFDRAALRKWRARLVAQESAPSEGASSASGGGASEGARGASRPT
jgi:RIO-like serine/threonine protein kinase